MEASFDAAKVLDELLGDKVIGPRANVFMAVPTIYVKLIEEAKRRGLSECDFSYLRLMVSGSAAMPRPIVRDRHDILVSIAVTKFPKFKSNNSNFYSLL